MSTLTAGVQHLAEIAVHVGLPRRKYAVLALSFVLGVFAGTSPRGASAQSTGKIKGVITDSETGSPLPGANVRVEGTTLGTITNDEGVFNLLRVPAGQHTLVASYVGYSKTVVENVRVESGLTAQITIELSPQTLEMGTVTVQADQSMVQQDVTSARQTYTREELVAAPSLTSSLDIFRLQGGTVVAGPPTELVSPGGQSIQMRAGQLKNIHLRGGRGGEILYLVDGLPINHPIYGGRSVLDIDLSDIERIEVIKGTFSAEYGDAQSAVVKIWTRSGREQYMGGFNYETDVVDVLGESFGRHYGTLYVSGADPITTDLLPSIGLDLPGSVTFYASLGGELSNTQYNNFRRRDTYNVLNLFDITAKQDNSLNFNGKLTYRVSPRLRITLNHNASWLRWSGYNWLWVGRPDGGSLADHMSVNSRDVQNTGLRVRHTLSDHTYYELRFGYLDVNFRNSLEGLTPADYWFFSADTSSDQRGINRGYERVPSESATTAPQVDPLTGFYDERGFESNWRHTQTSSYTFKSKITSQVHPNHMVRAGLDLQNHSLDYVDIQGGGSQLSNYGRYIAGLQDSFFTATGKISGADLTPPPGPYKLFGQNRWFFRASPWEGAVFLEDKFEHLSLVVNAGVRLGWFLPGETVFRDAYINQWCRATGLIKGETPEYACIPTSGSSRANYDVTWDRVRMSVNPRFGVSFPILTRTQLYFSYGHFSQLPELQFYYRDPFTGGGFVGNPGLDYVETIKYEFGFRHQFADNWAVDVKTYNRNVSGQVGTTHIAGTNVNLMDNKGYARARGFELRLENRNRYATHTSGEATYTVQWAKGYSSSAFEDFVRSQTNMPTPIRERRLDWDIRHQFILRSMLKSPDVNPLRLFGVELPSDWRLSILSTLASGHPYTPGTLGPIARQQLYNTETGPLTMRTDVKFRKRFDVAGGKLGFYINVSNIFNQHNAVVGDGYFWFNQWTGSPYRFGDMNQPSDQVFSWYNMYRLMSPRQYTLGRHVTFGIRFNS